MMKVHMSQHIRVPGSRHRTNKSSLRLFYNKRIKNSTNNINKNQQKTKKILLPEKPFARNSNVALLNELHCIWCAGPGQGKSVIVLARTATQAGLNHFSIICDRKFVVKRNSFTKVEYSMEETF